jgi:hypothetical protein
MSKLFDKPTIKNWIEFSGGGTQAKTQKAVSPIKRVSREGYKAKR